MQQDRHLNKALHTVDYVFTRIAVLNLIDQGGIA
jgi:hypothetical protein